MNLSFSTKGWNGYSFQNFCDIANELGFSGIELYDIHSPDFSDKYSPANPVMAAPIRREMMERKLTITCLDSVGNLADTAAYKQVCAEITSCIHTAPTSIFPMYAFAPHR